MAALKFSLIPMFAIMTCALALLVPVGALITQPVALLPPVWITGFLSFGLMALLYLATEEMLVEEIMA